ncbi:MAG: ergothioneine biosynthesis protein EgtB [Tatlockia sp.]|nr:ergothioneine biosynthesis protein EgtB [Tatlockia sp.]
MSTKEELIGHYQAIRQQTETLCQPLAIEDYVIQSIEDVSPPKWHLAHSSWFFETFILDKWIADYKSFDPSFRYVFNSYYQGVGNPYPRAKRGLLSRPGVEKVYSYRHYVDEQILALLKKANTSLVANLAPLIELGLHHEQQHQELLVMDIKHNFSIDPTFPCYQTPLKTQSPQQSIPQKAIYIEIEGGLVDIGHLGEGFCYDIELPVHKKFLNPYRLASQLVSNADYLEFIASGAYQEPRFWLADGWICIQNNNWQAPLYWHQLDNKWFVFGLNGLRSLDPTEPVSHLSYYEADAYARWREARLPTEEEWEHFVRAHKITKQNNFMEKGLFRPQAALSEDRSKPNQFFGELWQWTSSAYSSYPGFKPIRGELGEYNGKFMNNQMVLRGGSCVTPSSHIRASYRNFYQPEKRWQFSGIRLAQNVKE